MHEIKANGLSIPSDVSVIGIDDIRYADVREEANPTIYFATEGWSWADWEFGVVVRTVNVSGDGFVTVILR